ncbi:hypothetical protein LUZ63_024098 [Rhynchospora breviuscula]|uniref:Uncharacterized protein n=1 Tax=Rhynchospora breviuscula TaxID=2022672 RepID=A0A9P9Z2C9_9POAL|nr:hypothetical protein LUZ63_024098 [Rhynchospora breviuscula]
MRFWDLRAPWLEPLRGSKWFGLEQAEKRHTTLARTTFGRIYDSRSFRFFKFRHLWHAGRARAAAAGFEKGIDRDLEPVLFMTPLN